MKVSKLIYGGIISLALAALACQASDMRSVTQALPITPLPDDVLFQDDFSNPQSGWDRTSEESGASDYAGDAYRIQVSAPDSETWANPGLNFTDVRVEVDASKTGGPDDNLFGVICRYNDPDHFYFFVLSSDGYYGIGKMKDGKLELLGGESFKPSEAIHQGKRSNSLRAECVGERLILYANGTKLAEQQDGDYPGGDVGLIAGTFTTPGTEITFDRFVVRLPSGQ